MTPEDIRSGDYLAEWLRAVPTGTAAERDRAHRLSVAIAHRAAMRVLPVILDPAPSQKPGVKELLFFRLNLTAGVAAMGSRLKVARAVERAAAIANTAHTASTDAAPDKTRHATMSATNATRCAAYAAARDAAANEAAAAAYAAAATDPDTDPDAVHDAGNHAATDAAAYAGDAADAATDAGFASSGATGSSLSALRTDCAAWEAGRPPEGMPLWPGENPLHDLWARARAALLADGPGWAFWVDWYDKALEGEPQDWAGLLSEVVLIPPEDWDRGADHLNARIAQIQESYVTGSATPQISTIQAAVAQNAQGIPAVLEALIATLDDEIERLRGKNSADDLQQAELENQRRFLERLRGTVISLGNLVPARGAPSQADTGQIEGLLQIYLREFREWPRDHAAELVDSSCRAVLVGLTTAVGLAFGFPPLIGITIGGFAFGGAKLVGIAKSIREQVGPSNSG